LKALASLLLAFVPAVLAAQAMQPMAAGDPSRPVPLVQGLGNEHHAIQTTSPEAQAYFNQGLNYIFAFNHDEARRSFDRAASLDPAAPMPLWGLALAVGPNYNDIDIGHVRATEAMQALAHARALAGGTHGEEHDLVAALSSRYAAGPGNEPQIQGHEYASAMKALAAKYPEDPDVATLYAESLMDLNPWKLWSSTGAPGPDTLEIVATLQRVIAAHPNHVGANHLLIHAVEASPDAALGEASANRLAALAPAAGHLVHMPAHIYQRVGRFDDAANANEKAVEADRAYFSAQHVEGVENMYFTMYYAHNMHFLASSCSMEGRDACTQEAARELVDQLLPGVRENQATEWYTPTQPWMLVRFARWKQILATQVPSAEQYPVLAGMWHYARGCAFAAHHQVVSAARERDILAGVSATLPPALQMDFNNPAKTVFAIAVDALDARIREEKGNRQEAIEFWRKATALWDTLAYNEPADWYYPVRESLGGALLRDRKPEEAEAVFRADLKINPGSGRSLFGLAQALRMQGRTAEAAAVQADFEHAWAHADTRLTINGL
jgi:tetratricopeptide (TPR) repeat protein